MLLLTVTTDTQGRRRSDSYTASEGELVTLAETNDCAQFEPTSPWPRSFQGLGSGALTASIRPAGIGRRDELRVRSGRARKDDPTHPQGAGSVGPSSSC